MEWHPEPGPQLLLQPQTRHKQCRAAGGVSTRQDTYCLHNCSTLSQSSLALKSREVSMCNTNNAVLQNMRWSNAIGFLLFTSLVYRNQIFIYSFLFFPEQTQTETLLTIVRFRESISSMAIYCNIKYFRNVIFFAIFQLVKKRIFTAGIDQFWLPSAQHPGEHVNFYDLFSRNVSDTIYTPVTCPSKCWQTRNTVTTLCLGMKERSVALK